MRNIILLLLLSSISLTAQNQLLKEFNGEYLFKLTSQQADSLYMIRNHKPHESYFDNLVGSFPQNQIYRIIDDLPKGHYLRTSIRNNVVHYNMVSIDHVVSEVINNHRDLIVQIRDVNGQLVGNANLEINNCKLSYDVKTRSYVRKKSYDEGILKITINDFSAYREIDSRRYKTKYAFFKRLKLIRFSHDLLRTIRKKRPTGMIVASDRKFQLIKKKIRNTFLSDDEKDLRLFSSYIECSKPTYKIDDKIQCTAFLLDENFDYINDSARVYISGMGINGDIKWQKKLVGIIKPTLASSYQFEVQLGDSLQLLPDRTYDVLIQLDHGHFSKKVRIEQYTLQALTFRLINPDEEIYKNVEQVWKFSSIDENNLPILDGKINIRCMLQNRSPTFKSKAEYIPYLLLDTLIDVDPSGTTSFSMDSFRFPIASFGVSMKATLVTEDLQKASCSHHFYYRHQDGDITIHTVNDSIYFQYFNNGKEIDTTAVLTVERLWSTDTFLVKSNQLINVDFTADDLDFEVGETYEYLNYYEVQPNLQFFHSIDPSALLIKSHNPRNIAFSYYLYRGDREIKRGYGRDLDIMINKPGMHVYTLQIMHKWGEEIKTQDFVYAQLKSQLNIQVEHSKRIYPGEEVEFKINVTDYQGNAVKDLNLMAHALTSKFNHQGANVRKYVGKKKYKLMHNSFDSDDIYIQKTRKLNKEILTKLDTLGNLPYYKFIFPDTGYVTTTIPAKDSITQFAPFVYKDGIQQPVHIIYLDFIPVYFSWTNIDKFSFPVTPGKHHIQIRTEEKHYTLRNVDMKEGVKSLISLEDGYLGNDFSVEERVDTLTSLEKKSLSSYILALDMERNEKNALFVSNMDTTQFFTIDRSGFQLLGPFRSGKLTYHHKSYKLDFYKENNYSHAFSSRYVKMKLLESCRGESLKFPSYLRSTKTKNLHDQYFSKKDLRQQFSNQRIKYLREQLVKAFTPALQGDAQLRVKQCDLLTDFTILYNYNKPEHTTLKDGRLSSWSKLEEGSYAILVIDKDNNIVVYDSLFVKSGGVTYYDLSDVEPSLYENLSLTLPGLMDSIFNQYQDRSIDFQIRRLILKQAIQDELSFDDEAKYFYGKVTDQSGESVIGATIVDQSTGKGVTSDFDGNFRLQIVDSSFELSINSIGYERITVYIEDRFSSNTFVLSENSTFLEEVAIVAYKVPLIDFDQTSSTSKVSAESIQSSPLKSISGLAATSAGLTINNDDRISIRGSRSEAVYYYVDGIRVTADQLPSSEIAQEVIMIDGSEAKSVYGAEKVFLITTTEHFKLEASRGSSMRNNFTDLALWKPNILTDKNGQATFKTTFPDDITSWDVFFYAANDKKQTGKSKSTIQSFKPLSVSLATPKFLIKGDEINILSQVKNYDSDTTNVQLQFSVNRKLLKEINEPIYKSFIDSTFVKTFELDSLEIKYSLSTSSDYRDGESHHIPLKNREIIKTTGAFSMTRNQEIVDFETDTFQNNFTLYVEADKVEILRREIKHIHNYKHFCNEQLASKLMALLADRKFCELFDEEFVYDDMIAEIVEMLRKRYQGKDMWGWWEESMYSSWISSHVLKALSQARKAGFHIPAELFGQKVSLSAKFFESKHPSIALDELVMLMHIDSSFNTEKYMEKLDTMSNKSFLDSLRILDIKAGKSLSCDPAFAIRRLQSDIFGRRSVKHTSYALNSYHIQNNQVITTLLLCRSLQKIDSEKYASEIAGMHMFLMSARINNRFRNTYESIQIIELLIEEVGKDVVLNTTEKGLIISGDLRDTIFKLPYKRDFEAGTELLLQGSELGTYFMTVYSDFVDTLMHKKEAEFSIDTRISSLDSTTVKLARKAKFDLVTTVSCKNSTEYIMLEIPIPAGAKYWNKPRKYNETHRAYYDDKVLIFIRKLNAGEHTFTIPLEGQFSGEYTLLPAQVELMYFPTFSANEEVKIVEIK